MRVVVTGANGFVGIHTVKALAQKGYEVVAVDLNVDRLESLNHSIIYHQDDITETKFLYPFKKYIQSGDKVLHLAAVSKFAPAEENPQQAVRVNVEGTLNIINACIAAKAERLVYSSTGSIYSTKAQVPIREDASIAPNSVYGLTKKMAEDWILFYAAQLPYVILRYGYIYGNQKDWGAVGAFIKKLSLGEAPVVYGGNQTNDFVYIKDIVEANILALETPYTRNIYNIGTGRATSIRDVCEYCIKAMQSPLKMRLEPARTFDFPVFLYDISKARSVLGFEPEWNVLDGIMDMVKNVAAQTRHD